MQLCLYLEIYIPPDGGGKQLVFHFSMKALNVTGVFFVVVDVFCVERKWIWTHKGGVKGKRWNNGYLMLLLVVENIFSSFRSPKDAYVVTYPSFQLTKVGFIFSYRNCKLASLGAKSSPETVCLAHVKWHQVEHDLSILTQSPLLYNVWPSSHVYQLPTPRRGEYDCLAKGF